MVRRLGFIGDDRTCTARQSEVAERAHMRADVDDDTIGSEAVGSAILVLPNHLVVDDIACGTGPQREGRRGLRAIGRAHGVNRMLNVRHPSSNPLAHVLRIHHPGRPPFWARFLRISELKDAR